MWRDKEEEYVELEGCYIGAVTEKAILVHFENEPFWVPKSCIREPEQFEKWDEDVTVEVAEWFARKESII